ncbi:MAG: hypothetical protein GX638_02710 [Crenarchaeota archaeon]|nr:hypothetical protein [Thermoproteota archaeon]
MLRIERSYYDDFTSGILTSNIGILKQLIYTLELPYLNNQRNISCVPTGQYKLVKHTSPKFKECFLLENVKDRENILIHTGNYTKDTQGCILVGFKKQHNTILESRKALNYLLETLPDETELIIG